MVEVLSVSWAKLSIEKRNKQEKKQHRNTKQIPKVPIQTKMLRAPAAYKCVALTRVTVHDPLKA